MPILQFYTSPNQLTSDEKAELVKTITERYMQRLPAFFVNVMFNEVRHPSSSPSPHPLPSTYSLSSSYPQLISKYQSILISLPRYQLPHGDFYVGGKPTEGKFVRVTIDHIAMNWERGSGREKAKGYLEWLGGVLRERFEGRGWTLVSLYSSFLFLIF
jgi:hypothetical protein